MSTRLLFIPGHNTTPHRTRFALGRLAAPLFGFRLHILDIHREPFKDGVRTSTVTEEVEQAREQARRLQMSGPLIIAGHSQGGPVAAKVASEGMATGVVFVMGDPDDALDAKHHLQKLHTTLNRIRKDPVPWEKRGATFWYTHHFFDDRVKHDTPAILSSLEQPVLYIAGTHDKYNTPSALRKLSDRTPNGAFVDIDEEHSFGILGMLKVLWHIRRWWNDSTLE